MVPSRSICRASVLVDAVSTTAITLSATSVVRGMFGMIPLAVSDMPSDYARYRPTANAGNGTIAAVQGASVEYRDMTTAHITDHSAATPARGGCGGSGGRSRRATGTALARLATVARWTLAVAACLWIALCVAVGPLYWADSSIADFGAVNWLFAVVGFLVPFAAVVAMTRWANGIPVFGWSSGKNGLHPRRLIPAGARRAAARLLASAPGSWVSRTGRFLARICVRATDRWWKIALILFIGWLWVPTTLLSAFGADIRSQAREFSWAWNQWTGLDQPYIGFFSFVPMDIYPTAHYIWPSNPTYLTDQHNIVLTVLYGAVLSVSRYFTDSNDVGFVVLSSAQFLFAAFCCAATANRFFNLPWLPRRAGIDFTHPERGLMALVMLDFTHPERGYASPGFAARACAGNGRLPEGASGWFSRLVIILFFLCCPLAVFSTISLTKSPLFAFSFVWAFGVWYELFRTWRGKGDKVVRLRRRSFIALILACVVMLASAKYAWYIIVLQLILALLSDHRRWKAYVVALLLPVIVLHGGVVMLTRTGAIVSGDPIESHGVQLQQIARIAKRNPGSIPQSAREEIAPIFNLDQMADAYQPQDADPVKSSGIQSKKVSYRWRSVTQEDMARFNSAWWQIVKADPVTAIDALLAKCFGYFNPMDQPYVSMDYYVNSDYVTDQTTWIKYWCSEWRQSIAEGAKQFGEIPVLGWVAHGNLYVMMTLLIGAAEVVLRRWRTLVMHLPLLLLMGVMITAPANNFERHMLPVAFVFGFVVLTFWRESQRARRNADIR